MKNPIVKLAPIPSKPRSVITSSLSVLTYLCERARPDEIEQFEALTHTPYDPEAAAVAFWRSGKWSLAVAHPNGEPAAAGGYEQVQPGVWQSWMVGTVKGWEEMWIDIHRTTRFLTEALVDSGLARRLQTNALAKRAEALEWYTRLGLQYEGTMRGAGAMGEDVAWFGRVVPGADEETT